MSLSNHYPQNLINGDCLQVLETFSDKQIDLIVTDPPYGNILTKRNGNGVLKESFTRYGGETWDYKPSRKYFEEILRVSKNQVIFGGNYFSDCLPASPCWIVWDKNRISAQSFSDCELAWTSFDGAIKFVKIIWDGFRRDEDPGIQERRIHPTQKPVKLFEWVIQNYAKAGDLICDPFFGSAACLIAAIRLGHPFLGIEKDKSYFESGSQRVAGQLSQMKLIPEMV